MTAEDSDAPVTVGRAAETPLAELSRLLGIQVTDVHRTWVHTTGRGAPQSPNAWRLELPDAVYGLEDPVWCGDGRRWSRAVTSRALRSSWALNRWAVVWGRDPDLPPLTKQDGRAALRALHDAVEAADREMTS